mgnify:CR=1 FL=1
MWYNKHKNDVWLLYRIIDLTLIILEVVSLNSIVQIIVAAASGCAAIGATIFGLIKNSENERNKKSNEKMKSENEELKTHNQNLQKENDRLDAQNKRYQANEERIRREKERKAKEKAHINNFDPTRFDDSIEMESNDG